MSDLVMYILMRNDLESLNPGKAMAQAAHAASMMAREYGETETYRAWIEAGDKSTFGTTIVLAANELSIIETFKKAADLGYPTNLVDDPTYPIRDGKVTHYINLMTCGYILCSKVQAIGLVTQFPFYD